MEIEDNNQMVKRMRPSLQEKETAVADDAIVKVSGEENEDNLVISDQMELEIARIHEKIERFTQMVSELLDSGKLMLRELSNEFEERMILIHKEQMEKWQEEIKELRLLDASNEETNAVLHNAKFLFRKFRVKAEGAAYTIWEGFSLT